MSDASEIKHAKELLRMHLTEWRDAGGHVESVTTAILRLIVARERFSNSLPHETQSRCPDGLHTGEQCMSVAHETEATLDTKPCTHRFANLVMHCPCDFCGIPLSKTL